MKIATQIRNLDQNIATLERYTQTLNAKEITKKSTEYILAEMVDQCPLPMWVKDLQSTMLFFNNAYANIYNADPQKFLGHTDTSVWPEDVAKDFMANDIEVLSGDRAYKVEIIPTQNRNRKDAERDHITVVKWLVKIEGKPVGIAGIVTSVFP